MAARSEATHRNSDGMATCCMIVFTAHGSSRRLPSLPASKISTLVKVRIEKDGHVSKFEIIKPSENVVVNESVAAIAKRVTEVDSPPTGLAKGDHYDVKINFELNTNQETAK